MSEPIQKRISAFDTSLWEKILEGRYAEREKKRLETLQRVEGRLRSYCKDKGFKRVYLFGSILKEGEFYDFSDIDIAIEALGNDYFRFCAEIEGILEREIEVVEIERCKFKESIEKYGLRIL